MLALEIIVTRDALESPFCLQYGANAEGLQEFERWHTDRNDTSAYAGVIGGVVSATF
jgi:hypothetical protein